MPVIPNVLVTNLRVQRRFRAEIPREYARNDGVPYFPSDFSPAVVRSMDCMRLVADFGS